MNENLGFVILHYNTEIETKDCVNSILAHVPEASIVVVDNGSKNGSGNKLKKFYESLPVTVLCLKENMGFARGNNAGICYLRKNTSVKFIVVMNSDTLVKQDNLEAIIEQEYEKSEFAVMGPQIITKDGDRGTNPVEYLVDSKKKARRLILKREMKLLLNRVYMNWLIKDVGTGVVRKGLYDPDKRYEDVKLHGACWIFSPKYFECFSGLCDKTFLYFEEDILFLHVSRKGLKTVYNPEIHIVHLEDATTNSIAKTSREKNMFVLKNELKSLRVLMKVIEE